ncbi:hypothetical protein N9934_01675 [Desulfosarcina sp.]|nr:hypothetical protein [Desulfosarcina sp.]
MNEHCKQQKQTNVQQHLRISALQREKHISMTRISPRQPELMAWQVGSKFAKAGDAAASDWISLPSPSIIKEMAVKEGKSLNRRPYSKFPDFYRMTP